MTKRISHENNSVSLSSPSWAKDSVMTAVIMATILRNYNEKVLCPATFSSCDCVPFYFVRRRIVC